MTTTIYANFNDVTEAEKAVGALLDHGMRASDISLISNQPVAGQTSSLEDSHEIQEESELIRERGKTGISTTTSADAEAGATKGATIGLGVGIVAALASVFLPGIGLIVGGGALAVAIAGAAATTGAGAIAGGVYGYLRDQGVPEEAIENYRRAYAGGGTILAADVSDAFGRTDIEGILMKYGAQNVNYYNIEAINPAPRAELY